MEVSRAYILLLTDVYREHVVTYGCFLSAGGRIESKLFTNVDLYNKVLDKNRAVAHELLSHDSGTLVAVRVAIETVA
jgi:hypothetical protein